MPKEYLKKVAAAGQRVNPLFGFLGVKVELISAEKVVLRLPLRDDFRQGAQVIAGGVMAALADEAMAHLVLANLSEGQSTATLEMNLRFFKSIQKGELVAEAALIKKGRQVFALEARILDEKNQLLALAGASFMVIEKKM